jgi:hypothetical protein
MTTIVHFKRFEALHYSSCKDACQECTATSSISCARDEQAEFTCNLALQDIKLSEVTQKMAELEMRMAQELAPLWALKVQITHNSSTDDATAFK